MCTRQIRQMELSALEASRAQFYGPPQPLANPTALDGPSAVGQERRKGMNVSEDRVIN